MDFMRKAHVSVRVLLVPFMAMLFFCGVIAIITVALTNQGNAENTKSESKQAAMHLAKIAGENMEPGIRRYDNKALSMIISEMLYSDKHLKSCAIISPSFRYIAHSSNNLSGTPLEDDRIISLIKHLNETSSMVQSKTISIEGTSYVASVSPIISGGKASGYAMAVSSFSDRSNYLVVTSFVLFLGIGVFVLTASLMILRESVFVLSPLKDLNKAVKKLAEEGGAEKIHYDSGGDLGELIHEFNLLIDKWKMMYEQSVKIQKETAEQKRLSDAVVDNIANGIIVLDSELTVQRVNRTAELNLDISAREAVGKKFYEILPGWEKEKSEEVARRVIEKDETYYNERVYHKTVGLLEKRTVFNISICPIRDDENRTRGAVALFEFLTDKVQLEEHLLKSNEELKRANEVKSEFLSMVSHELRTPLTLIKMYSSMMDARRMGPLNDQQAKAVEVIHRRCRNLHELIDDLLDLSKIESGRLEFHIQEVSIYDILKDLEETHAEKAEERELKLVFDAEPGMPKILADKDKLFRVINNLIENSLKFTETGKIEIAAQKDPGNNRQALIRVTDTGCGIPDDCKDKVFDKFFQVDGSDTRKYGGSGLGLSIAQEIVALHHGRLWLESSAEGEGSAFALTIPFTHPDMITALSQAQLYTGESGVKDSPALSRRGEKPQAVSGNNVLLIDDDKDFIDMITDILTDDGYIVHSALSGIDGMNILFSEKPVDIILLDVSMQNLSGYEVCKMIKAVEDKQNIPVLMLTAFGMSEQIKNGYEAGAAGYLVKPFTIEAFKETMDRIMGGRENAT